MKGIDLNQTMTYRYASFRFFEKGERHVSRVCGDDVLVMVFEGVLRFWEDGVEYEIHPGQYHIQQWKAVQKGTFVSDKPHYLYVHFRAKWGEGKDTLPYRGTFDLLTAKPLMKEMNRLSHGDATLVERQGMFYRLLTLLIKEDDAGDAENMADYIRQNCGEKITLDNLSKQFHFSKNYLIHLFKKEHGMTPFAYIHQVRLKKAEEMLEITSKNAQRIARECGFGEYAYFYKLFVKKHGVSPSKWRKEKQMYPVKE